MKILVLNPAMKGIKNVVRDFLYGCWCAGRHIGGMQMPPLSLLYVATLLKNNGHDVDFIDACMDYVRYETALKNAGNYNIIVMLTSTNSFRQDIQVFREFKKSNPQLLTVLFGAHPTFMPEETLKEDCVNIIVRREPEYILRDMVNIIKQGSDDWHKIPGIGFKINNEMQINQDYPFIHNLDELPIPDRSLLPSGSNYFNPVVKRLPYTTMLTSRGCQGECNFCTVPSFFGIKTRMRSTENVLKEIELIVKMGFKEIFFRDENFTSFQKRNNEIFQTIIEQKLNLSWICNSRVDMLNEPLVCLMKKAGCHMIKFGVESGNQNILNNLDKDINLEDTSRAFSICRKYKVDTHAHIMLGCIGENRETIEDTIKFVKRLEPTTASFGIFTPYPGTEVFNQLIKKHPDIMDGSIAQLGKLNVKVFFNQYFSELTIQELEHYVRIAYREFYFRFSFLWKRLLSVESAGELTRKIIAAFHISMFGIGGDN